MTQKLFIYSQSNSCTFYLSLMSMYFYHWQQWLYNMVYLAYSTTLPARPAGTSLKPLYTPGKNNCNYLVHTLHIEAIPPPLPLLPLFVSRHIKLELCSFFLRHMAVCLAVFNTWTESERSKDSTTTQSEQQQLFTKISDLQANVSPIESLRLNW